MIQSTSNSADLGLDRYIALWEVASVIVSCLIAEWAILAFVGKNKIIMAIPIVFAIGLMLFSHRERGESPADLGFRLDNLIAALRLVALPTLAVVLVALIIGVLTSQTLYVAPWRHRFLVLPLWALFQQYVLNGFINRRLQIALGSGPLSVLLVGIAFGLLHLPNLSLSLLTFGGGLIWGWCYQRRPNLFALAISHTIASITLALAIPPSILSLRVGFKVFG